MALEDWLQRFSLVPFMAGIDYMCFAKVLFFLAFYHECSFEYSFHKDFIVQINDWCWLAYFAHFTLD